MPGPQTQCSRTCRHLYPDNPELWCAGCKDAEAIDREANWQRWRDSETRREVLAIVAARLAEEAAR